MGWRWGESRRKWGTRWTLRALLPCLVLLLLGMSTSGAAAAPIYGGNASARPAIPGTPPAPRAADGVAALGLGLLGKLPPGNAVISPDSVATALAMVGTGAVGPSLFSPR